jgi:hypothetical protein
MNGSLRWLSQLLVLSIAVAGSVLGVASGAQAATVGTPSITYSGVVNPPTADKPQSKLWWNDGSWWANMWTTGSGWSIYRLDRGAAKWVNTGVRSDSRASTSSDTLWDGRHLYIASNVVTSGAASTGSSTAGLPARLYRYSYSNGTYTLSSGFPTTISNSSSASLTIAKDSTGAVWATWTHVAGGTSTVFVNKSASGGTSWGTPFVVPGAPDPNPTPDDLSAIVAYEDDEIGIMWTDQGTGTAWWATHDDEKSARDASSWKVKEAMKGNKRVDDHLNIKALQADPSGRVFAAVKTSLNEVSRDPNLAQLVLVVFKPATGSFSQTTIARTGDCVSRPQIMLDTRNNLVHAFYTAPSTSVSGCPFTGAPGSIYEKTASMDNPVFGTGRGKPVIEDANSPNMNNVTSTKQSVNSATGIVVLASNHVTKRYWFSDRSLGAAAPPPDPISTGTGISVRGSTTANASTATGTVSLAAPAGRAAGDVLVASFTADLNPTVAVPAGWTPIVNGLSINSTATTGARVFAYYRVVGSTNPATYTWTLSKAAKWGGGITAYTGVSITTPLDSAVTTAVNATYTATSLTVPSVTTAKNGARLIGGVGFDNATPGATAPTGWTERWEAANGQIAQQADRTQATAGASGTATWTFSAAKAAGAWRTALKPAG